VENFLVWSIPLNGC
jgi:hypothetical protein